MTAFSPLLPAVREREGLIRDVQAGFQPRPRSLKPGMFYDEPGSQLFEQITTLAEYHPTRARSRVSKGNQSNSDHTEAE
jgi:L-histidine Nalpha-methyltransferase